MRQLTPVILSLLLAGVAHAQRLTYPPAPRGDTVDDYHGTPVADPYRWMEEESSPELKEWIDGENDLTFGWLDQIESRPAIRERLKALWNYPKFSVPFKEGGRLFFTKNDGLQNQAVLFMQRTPTSELELILDPNALSADGTVALSTIAPCRDGVYLAYGLSSSGSDWQEIFIRDLDERRNFNDTLRWCKFSSIAWHPNGLGFYYNRFRDPATAAPGEETLHNKVYWHTVGTPQSEDKLVYERPDAPELSFSPQITEDGKYLLLHVWRGTDTENRVYYRPLDSSGDFIRLLDEADASYNFIDNMGAWFLFQTNLDAPKGRIIAINLKKPARKKWREWVPEGRDPISFVSSAGGHLVVATLTDAHHRLTLLTNKGKKVREISLPTLGAVSGFWGRVFDDEMFFGFTSFLFPPTVFRYHIPTGDLSIHRKPKVAFDPSGYETKQVFVTSKDGTQVPMFLTHRKGIALDGSHPTLLYGYGGFNVDILPHFSIQRTAWLEMGGIYAVATLRGGSEYGEEWHRAGMLANKQNVFDDFIACAEWLLSSGHTSRSRLAIQGGSNGGLLVSACAVQRPDLFGAVICNVPVTDMLRYHRFTVGRYWTGEYGNAEENADDFQFLRAYSPLHNVRDGAAYPPMLITTADHDDRVVPAHAMKLAAALQSADGDDSPVLVRIETKAGHGGGKPTSKQIEEAADVLSFLERSLKLERESAAP